MNKGRLYVPKGSKLYIAAVILAFVSVLIKPIVELICFGAAIEFLFTQMTGSYYLSFVKIAAELCIPVGFILARKDIRFAAMGNIAILVYMLIGIFDTIARIGMADSSSAGYAFLAMLFSIPYIFATILLPNGVPLLYIMCGSRSKTAFTALTSVCMFLYAMTNSGYSVFFNYSSIIGSTRSFYIIPIVLIPVISMLTITAAYICFGLSLKNTEVVQSINYPPYPPYPPYQPYPVYPQYPQYQQYPPQYMQPMPQQPAMQPTQVAPQETTETEDTTQ